MIFRIRVLANPGAHTLFVTETTATTHKEPTSDLLEAKAECISIYENGEDYISTIDEDLFTLCQYIRSLFPDDFP